MANDDLHERLDGLKLIVAVCANGAIGNEGKLLVRNKDDMRHYVELTSGNIIIMGRATLDSFPGGAALKNRRNIVFTRNNDFERENVEAVHNLTELADALEGDEHQAWVVGGQHIYELLLPYCNEAEVTYTYTEPAADTFFPDLDEDPAWQLARVYNKDTTPEGIAYEFRTYRRKAKEL